MSSKQPSEPTPAELPQTTQNGSGRRERSKRRLPADIREKTKRLFDLLGRTQKAFCDDHDVTESTLSSALAGNRSIPPEMWRKVLHGLKRELLIYQCKSPAALDVTTAQTLLDDIFASIGEDPGISMPSPGGSLPVATTLYVARDDDRRIRQYVAEGRQSLFALVGAPQTGRSSFLIRLADWAEDAAFSVIIIDFLDYLAAMRTM